MKQVDSVRSAVRFVSGERIDFRFRTSHCSTLSCLQVYLPWLKAEGQPLRMWSVVRHERSTQLAYMYNTCFISPVFEVERGGGVSRMSEAARRMKDSRPAGKLYDRLDYPFLEYRHH